MSVTQSLAGCKVMIHPKDNPGQVLAQTTIQEHNRVRGIITVPRQAFRASPPNHVLVMVRYQDRTVEFQGSVRKYGDLRFFEVALYQESDRQKKRANRFAVNAPAVIQAVAKAGAPKALEEPAAATVLNISKGGLLLRTAQSLLQKGDEFQLKMTMGQEETLLNCTVVHQNKQEGNYSDYGCQFISLEVQK